MEQQRMGELAYKILVERTVRRGFRVSKDHHRHLHDRARDLGISIQDADLFARMMFRDVAIKVFPDVSIQIPTLLPDVRRNEIALMVARHELRKESFRLSRDFDRELADLAQAINENKQEVVKLFTFLIRELVDEAFPAPQ